MPHRGKRHKSFRSQKKHSETGTGTEKYEQLELPLVIDDTTLIPSLIQRATQESESSTPESVHISKSQTLNGKPTICNPCLQTENLVFEVGSGLNYKRKGLLSILGQVLSGDVKEVVVCHKDRLVRFGLDLIEWLCQQKDCQLVVLNRSDLSPEREMVEDILAIVHVFSCRLYGLRKYKSAIKKDSSLPRNDTS